MAALALLVAVAAMVGFSAQSASAHVLPSSSVILDVTADQIDASLRIPLDDLEAASGIDLGDGSEAEVNAHEEELRAYILAHFAPSSTNESPWTVTIDDFGAGSTEELGTGVYSYITATAHLVPRRSRAATSTSATTSSSIRSSRTWCSCPCARTGRREP